MHEFATRNCVRNISPILYYLVYVLWTTSPVDKLVELLSHLGPIWVAYIHLKLSEKKKLEVTCIKKAKAFVMLRSLITTPTHLSIRSFSMVNQNKNLMLIKINVAIPLSKS